MQTGDTKVIDGHTYLVRPLDPDIAYDMFWDLVNMLGNGIVQLARHASDDNPDGGHAMSDVLAGLVGRLDKVQIKDIAHKLAKVSDVDGKPLEPMYKVHFMGKLGSLTKWLVFALQVQFGDFASVFESIPTWVMPHARQAPEDAA